MRWELSLILSLVVVESVDCLAVPRRPLLGGGPRALFWRSVVAVWIWLVWFGLTGQAIFALTATAVTAGVVVAISNAKQRYLREPLVFADFALLEHAISHPHLFYIRRSWLPACLAGFAVLIGIIGVWMAIEPRSAVLAGQASAALLAVAMLTAIAVVPSGAWPNAVRRALVAEPNSRGSSRSGLLASLLCDWIGWLSHRVPTVDIAILALPVQSSYSAVIVIQSESFIDLRRFGAVNVQLPAFDRLTARSISSGLLKMPCQGAYTLRPESAVISGIGYADQGFDRFHPYLKPSRLAAAALPRLLSRAGLDTIFIHPHDGSFFRRDRAMPQFGFNRFVDEGAFCDTKRVGPYVSDEAVGEFLTVELKKSADAKRPIFLYAVTMEAHDPFGPGRLVNEDDPVRQYIHHIENADRMLACLEQDIATHHDRVLLVFFGDHVPFLPSFCDPFPDTRTDYFAIELGRNAKNYKYDAEVSRPEHLHGLIIRSLERRGCT